MQTNHPKSKLTNGLLFGYSLNNQDQWTVFNLNDFHEVAKEAKLIWLGFDYTKRSAKDWIKAQTNIPDFVTKALTAKETRPRTTILGNGALVNLRGMNFNPKAESQDMISVRTWVSEKLIVTMQRRNTLSMNDIKQAIEDNRGPTSAGDFIAMLCDYLTSRSTIVVDDLDDKLDSIEEEVLMSHSRSLRSQLAEVRRKIVTLRRYLAPQREAIYRLQAENLSWLSTSHKINLRESVDKATRHVEDLDSARDRAAVTQEELMGHLSEQIEQRTYLLTIVAAIFLPLSFITGLLGVNVGGIPGTQSTWGFTLVTGISLLIIVVEILFCKYKKWI